MATEWATPMATIRPDPVAVLDSATISTDPPRATPTLTSAGVRVSPAA
jgi:hypothetical protein